MNVCVGTGTGRDLITVTIHAAELPPDLVAAGWVLERVDDGWRAFNKQCNPPIQTMAFHNKGDAVGSAISMQHARDEGLLGLMGDSILRPRRGPGRRSVSRESSVEDTTQGCRSGSAALCALGCAPQLDFFTDVIASG
jgi:hypothetical protein